MGSKKWCRHVRMEPNISGVMRWFLNGLIYVRRGWRFCPICGSKRPAKGRGKK